MPKGRRHGSGNYSNDELVHMFACLAEILPIGPDEWQRVADKHSEKFPGRDIDSIRRKYATYHRVTIPTGDPKCPWYVKEAKRIKFLIGQKAEFGDGEDVFDIHTGQFNDTRTESMEDGIIVDTEQQPNEEPTTTQQQFQAGPPLRQPSQPSQPSQPTVDNEDEDASSLLDTSMADVGTPKSARSRAFRATPIPMSVSTAGVGPRQEGEEQKESSTSNSTPSSSSGKRSYRTMRSIAAEDPLVQVFKRQMEESRADRLEARLDRLARAEEANKAREAQREEREAAREEAREDRRMLLEAFRIAVTQQSGGRRKKKQRSNSSSSSSDDSE